MAGFEGVVWAPKQMQYGIHSGTFRIVDGDAKVYAISRSLHYGLFQVFEGIRFFCAPAKDGAEIRFVNLKSNLKRFRNGILYSVSQKDQSFVPSETQLLEIFLSYFRSAELQDFLLKMYILL